ncbi:GNAT family N-acetyltransferase [Candidatus Poribacteria bacterium]|nr:GNAT family N-acetyltransferase [Candidatus Poribacteria bacterium]
MKSMYWDVVDAGSLVHVYNEQFAGVPHCYPVSPEEFEIGIRYRKDADKPYDELHSEKFIVGEQNGKIVGFADVVVVETKENEQKKYKGLIRFLTYQPGCRAVGQALLEEAEKYLRDLGMDEISAFRITYARDDYSYRFYHLGFGLVSDQTMHIYALFRVNGYEINSTEQGEVFMDQPEYSVAEPMLPDNQVEIVVKQQPGRGVLPGLTVQAFRNGREIGVCESLSVGQYCQASEAQDWVFIKWIGVENEKRGEGWGRYLLQKNLWEMRKIGYKNTVISTDIINYRAQLFYTNYGYQVVDTTYGFVKNI